MSEMWDLYTKHRQNTGLTHLRCGGEQLPEHCYHLVVHVWLRNAKGQYMMSKRAASRPTHPLLWECPGGSVLLGEDSRSAAVRETMEEVGVCLQKEKGKRLLTRIRETVDGKCYRTISDVWLFAYDGPICLEQATTDEVEECRWMTVEEIWELHQTGKLVPSLSYFFPLFSDPRDVDCSIIGKQVDVVIDRPLGSAHPRHPEMIYPVNYGYVPGIMAPDGSEQDVYVLGEQEPLKRLTGTVIGVYHRLDDVEDKWIVTRDGAKLTKEWILGEIAFQEQFFSGCLYLSE